jgi:hypothetical protein
MRCLLRRDQYVANPSMYFCLITPPSLNHLFARVIDGLCTARRVLIFSSQADDLKARFQQDAVPNFDGPISFLKQVNEMSGFEHCVDKLIQYGLTEPEQWLHEIRSVWRKKNSSELLQIVQLSTVCNMEWTVIAQYIISDKLKDLSHF